jgi:pyruvate ferredoxin oxidoreductase gamma subunit
LRYNLKHKLATLDAMTIARECIGRPIVNTSMAGALLKVTNIVKPESLEEPMKEYFGERAKSNMEAMQKAYEQTKVW